MIIADTDVSVTQFEQSRLMLDHLDDLIAGSIPQGIRARVICAHSYTVANASTIQSDLVRVLLISVLGLAAIFLTWLRDRYAVYVFLIPGASLLAGMAATSLLFASVSTITIGFGAVLLGISVDFGLHVYFAVRCGNRPIREVLDSLRRPLSFCALTTIGVFAVMLFSALPVQRQLAVFSIAGIITALALSLHILPGLLRRRNVTENIVTFNIQTNKAIACVWLILLLLCGWQVGKIRLGASLRNIGVIPAGIRDDEQTVRNAWGNISERAMIFSEGNTLEDALEVNDKLFVALGNHFPESDVLSIASVIPSKKKQQDNRRRWMSFWQANNRAQTLRTSLYLQGGELGIRESAFDSFLQWIDLPVAGHNADTFAQQCNPNMIEPFLVNHDNRRSILTLVPDSIEMNRFFNSYDSDSVTFVSSTQFGNELDEITINDFIRLLAGAVAVVIILLFLLFRDLRKMTLCLSPAISGIVIMLAIMSFAGIRLNIFNVVAALLVTGLGVDYGILTIYAVIRGTDHFTRRAVLVSALTTFAGFGALAVARHPAMNSIGLTVVCGIVPAAFCAVIVMPSVISMSGIKPEWIAADA